MFSSFADEDSDDDEDDEIHDWTEDGTKDGSAPIVAQQSTPGNAGKPKKDQTPITTKVSFEIYSRLVPLFRLASQFFHCSLNR